MASSNGLAEFKVKVHQAVISLFSALEPTDSKWQLQDTHIIGEAHILLPGPLNLNLLPTRLMFTHKRSGAPGTAVLKVARISRMKSMSSSLLR